MTPNSEQALDPRTATPGKQRVLADDRLDALYLREMRCPYCQTKIPKGTSKCRNCGLTKDQIYHAKITHPYKPGREVLMSKVRPADLPYWQIALGGVFGFFGIHCFMTKRYVRGAVILLLIVAYIVSLIMFPPAIGESAAHAVRRMFEEKTYLFPGDLLGIIGLGMWVWDMLAIFFGQFKYPVMPEIGESA